MREGLVFERSGSGDDTALLVKVRMDGVAFDTDMYVGKGEFERVSASLSDFARGCLSAGGQAGMEFVLGPDLDSSPHVAVQLKTLRRGYVSVTVQLWRHASNNYAPALTDFCKIHFATDIASLDEFIAQCQRIRLGDRAEASLPGERVLLI